MDAFSSYLVLKLVIGMGHTSNFANYVLQHKSTKYMYFSRFVSTTEVLPLILFINLVQIIDFFGKADSSI